MPADERYDVAHERNKKTSKDKPGCYNRGPIGGGYYAPDRIYRPDGTYYQVLTFIKTDWIKYARCPNRSYAECSGCSNGEDGC